MSDLETALRAKLEEMQKEIDVMAAGEIPLNIASFLDGRDHAVNEMDDFLDSRPDGWHDLRKKPSVVPLRFETVFLIIKDGKLLTVIRAFVNEFAAWKNQAGRNRSEGPIGMPRGVKLIGWRRMESTPTIPDCFQKEKE